MASEHPGGDAYIKDNHEDVEKGDNLDDSKVKFINGGKADAEDVAVEISKPKPVQFAGMDKEELMQFANDPFWKKLRLILFIGFWIVWIAMLVAAIIIIVLAPKCPPKPDLDWYQQKPMYQIYPRSFKDTNGDGIGDLKGIEAQLPYLEKLGIGSIILASIYDSEDVDFGYDVTNHTAVHPKLGSLEDFDSLLRAAHKKRMKVILDFIPNHTSNKHKWFVESAKNKTNPYADYYVWADGTQANPPSNWLSKYKKSGSAWEWNAARSQFYYHTFFVEQPELNLKNDKVLGELEEVLKFWLERGVDGFRFGVASNYVEGEIKDEPQAAGATQTGNPYDALNHTQTVDQPGTFNVTARFRAFLDKYYGIGGFDQTKLMLVEGTDPAFYGTSETPGANLLFNYDLFDLKSKCDGLCLSKLIMDSAKRLPEGQWGTWLLGNHDTSRAATRVNDPKLINAVNTILLTLPGTPILYYGDEIGMRDIDQTSVDQVKDKKGKNFGTEFKKFSRDPERSPMQWTSKNEAGFTNATSWLPVHPEYVKYNVKSIDAHGASLNYLDVVRDLIKLRQQPSFAWGQIYTVTVNKNIFSFVRKAEGHPGYLVVMNVGNEESSDDYTSAVEGLVTKNGEVVFSSFDHADFTLGTPVEMNNVLIQPGNVVIFKLEN